ncbi:MAG: YcxB family protein [Terriglobales bacterium]
MLQFFALGSTLSWPLASPRSELILWRSPSSHWFGVAAVGVAVAFGLILLFVFFIIPPLAFRHQPKFRDDYSLTFSPEGIHFHTAHIDSRLEWKIYSRVLADAHCYILYWGSQTFTIIPKRVFQSAEQQKAFDQLIAEHVSKAV